MAKSDLRSRLHPTHLSEIATIEEDLSRSICRLKVLVDELKDVLPEDRYEEISLYYLPRGHTALTALKAFIDGVEDLVVRERQRKFLSPGEGS